MTGEIPVSLERSPEGEALDAWLNPWVRTGERRIMGPAACDIPSDFGRSALLGALVEEDPDPNAPRRPNARYMRYVSKDDHYSVDYFETDGDGNIIETQE